MSYVISGKLAHADSHGSVEVVSHGEFQIMSAGTGIEHRVFNASDIVPVHSLQIWILPARNGLTPKYMSARFNPDATVSLLAAPSGGLVHLNQAIEIWRVAPQDRSVRFPAPAGSRIWVQSICGPIAVDQITLESGDSAAIKAGGDLVIEAGRPGAELLVFVETQPGSSP